jgi:hypothetical protein
MLSVGLSACGVGVGAPRKYLGLDFFPFSRMSR